MRRIMDLIVFSVSADIEAMRYKLLTCLVLVSMPQQLKRRCREIPPASRTSDIKAVMFTLKIPFSQHSRHQTDYLLQRPTDILLSTISYILQETLSPDDLLPQSSFIQNEQSGVFDFLPELWFRQRQRGNINAIRKLLLRQLSFELSTEYCNCQSFLAFDIDCAPIIDRVLRRVPIKN